MQAVARRVAAAVMTLVALAAGDSGALMARASPHLIPSRSGTLSDSAFDVLIKSSMDPPATPPTRTSGAVGPTTTITTVIGGVPAAVPAIVSTAKTSTTAPQDTAPAVPGQEATVRIPSLGIELPVVEGGQAVIDEGVVAHYHGQGWLPPTGAGAVGTYWLAAHHVTHRGPFERLPSIRIGDQVRVTTIAHRLLVYTVTSLQVVGTTATYSTVYGLDPRARAILLQTCLDTYHRLLVHGILTDGTE